MLKLDSVCFYNKQFENSIEDAVNSLPLGVPELLQTANVAVNMLMQLLKLPQTKIRWRKNKVSLNICPLTGLTPTPLGGSCMLNSYRQLCLAVTEDL